MRNKLVVVCLALAVVLMVALPVSAAQPTTTTETITNLPDPCTGDTLSGTVTFTIQTTATGNHLSIHETIKGTLTGTSGTTYVVNAEGNENANTNAAGAYEGNLVLTQHINSQGGGAGSNLVIQEIDHITVNADGTVVVDRSNFNGPTCQ